MIQYRVNIWQASGCASDHVARAPAAACPSMHTAISGAEPVVRRSAPFARALGVSLLLSCLALVFAASACMASGRPSGAAALPAVSASGSTTATATPSNASSNGQQVTVYVHAGPTHTPIATQPGIQVTPIPTASLAAAPTDTVTSTPRATAVGQPTPVATVLPATGLLHALPGGPTGMMALVVVVLLLGAGFWLAAIRRS